MFNPKKRWTLYFLYKLFIFICMTFMSYDLFLYKFGLKIFTWGISSCLIFTFNFFSVSFTYKDFTLNNIKTRR